MGFRVRLCFFRPLLALAVLSASLNLQADDPAPEAGDTPEQQLPVQQDTLNTRVAVDRLLRHADDLQQRGSLEQARDLKLQAAGQLRRGGFERDQVAILRQMTLDPDPLMSQAGGKAMANYYYQKYLHTKPRDAQWLLEALAWAHYCGDTTLLKRFSARKPDKAHENIEQRARVRGEELRADDQLYLASELIRLNRVDELRQKLENWPYPIDRIHSLEGMSLLHSAVWHKKTGIARMLVEEYGANINVVDLQNDTPLDYAEYQQAEELIKYLKAKGGNSNKRYGKQKEPGGTP